MARRIIPVPNLVGGVSQQAEDVRFDGQMDSQVNAFPSPIDGLTRRHPTEHVALAATGQAGANSVHTINRDSEEQYLVLIRDKKIRVFDLEGDEKPVVRPGAASGSDEPDYEYLDAVVEDNLVSLYAGGVQQYPGETFDFAAGWTIEVADMENPVIDTAVDSPFQWGNGVKIAVKAVPGGATPGFIFFDLSDNYLPAGQSQHLSCYFKAGNISTVNLGWSNDDIGEFYGETFTLTGAGSVTDSGIGVETKIEAFGTDGWYYCRVSVDIGELIGMGATTAHNREVEVTLDYTGGGEYVYGFGMLGRNNGEPDVSYVNTAGFKALTVSDYTFILNSSKLVKLDGALTTPAQADWPIHINVDIGNYDTTYTATLEFSTDPDTESTVLTVDDYAGTGTSKVESIRTWDIAENLLTGRSGTSSMDSGPPLDTITAITVEREDSTIRMKATGSGGTIDTVRLSDSLGSDGMSLLWNEIDDLQVLPKTCTNGFVVKVNGPLTGADDDYWLRFHTDQDVANKFDTGRWEESGEPGLISGYAESTMPHQLVRMIDDMAGTITGIPYGIFFEFGPTDWTERIIGDADTNPMPTFVGKTISDIFFYRGRLGFLSDENIILSEVNQYFNFFRTTIINLLDGDPIDVNASSTSVSVLNAAVPFEKNLVLFADQAQFLLEGKPTLTPKTASITKLTAFDAFQVVEPQAVGQGILFGYQDGGFSGVRELFRESQSESNFDAHKLTSHVPHYLEGTITVMAASSLVDVAAFLTDADTSVLYVYKWTDSGRDRVQVSWSQYQFDSDADIRSVNWIEETLYITIQYSDGVYIEKMVFDNNPVDPFAGFKMRLDRRITEDDCVVAYQAGTDTTRYTLPYDLVDVTNLRAVTRATAGTTFDTPGFDYVLVTTDITTPGAHYFEVAGNTLTVPLWIGLVFNTEFTFSKLNLRSQITPTAQHTDLTSVYRVLYGNLSFSKSGYFEVDVTPYLGSTDTTVFKGYSLGEPGFILGEPSVIESGVFRFPILSKNKGLVITVRSNSHLPCSFLAAEWEANPVSKSTQRKR